jgi:Family of unknown function (DUF6152)
MRMRKNVLAATIGLFIVATLGSAHHAFQAEFDVNQPVTLRGVVTKVQLINPHAWIHIDVKDKDGKVTTWMIEGGTPNVLIRNGIRKDSLPIGSEVIVEGFRSKDGAPRANGLDITFPDGRKVLLGGSAPEPAKK